MVPAPSILIEYELERPKWMKAKVWRDLVKRAMFELGRYWHRAILPKHFTHRGAHEYGYQERQGVAGGAENITYNPKADLHYHGSGGDADINKAGFGQRRWNLMDSRTGKRVWAAGVSSTHTGRKIREKGHSYPLVFSGRLKFMATSMADIKASSKGVTIWLRGLPAYVKQRPHGMRSPDMAAELQAISPEDKAALMRFLGRAVQRGINRLGRYTGAGAVA